MSLIIIKERTRIRVYVTCKKKKLEFVFYFYLFICTSNFAHNYVPVSVIFRNQNFSSLYLQKKKKKRDYNFDVCTSMWRGFHLNTSSAFLLLKIIEL